MARGVGGDPVLGTCATFLVPQPCATLLGVSETAGLDDSATSIHHWPLVWKCIPGMGGRLDSAGIAGCFGLVPRAQVADAAVTTPSNVVSVVSTATTRFSNRPRPRAAACHGSTMLR